MYSFSMSFSSAASNHASNPWLPKIAGVANSPWPILRRGRCSRMTTLGAYASSFGCTAPAQRQTLKNRRKDLGRNFRSSLPLPRPPVSDASAARFEPDPPPGGETSRKLNRSAASKKLRAHSRVCPGEDFRVSIAARTLGAAVPPRSGCAPGAPPALVRRWLAALGRSGASGHGPAAGPPLQPSRPRVKGPGNAPQDNVGSRSPKGRPRQAKSGTAMGKKRRQRRRIARYYDRTQSLRSAEVQF